MASHHRGTGPETRALNAYITLMRSAESVTVRTTSSMAEAGLTTSQFGTLEALYHLGPMHQKDVGQKLLKTSGNIVMVVDNLEKRGLVKRKRDSDDRRCVLVHLTDKGRRLISEVFPRVLRDIVKQMGALSAVDQETLRSLCRKLGRKME